MSLSAAVSAVPVLPYPALQPPQTQLLCLAQAMRDHYVPGLEEAAASSPRGGSPGQPAGVFPSSLERKAVGSAGCRTWSGTNGYPIRALSDGEGIIV